MDGFESHDAGGTTDVEQVLANTEVACAAALLATEVREAMFHGDSLAEAFATFGSCDELS